MASTPTFVTLRDVISELESRPGGFPAALRDPRLQQAPLKPEIEWVEEEDRVMEAA